MGFSLVNPTALSTDLRSIGNLAGDNATDTFAAGYAEDGSITDAGLEHARSVAKGSDVAIVYLGLPIVYEHESWDRPELRMPEGHVQLVAAVAKEQPQTVVVLSSGSVVDMTNWIDQVPAVLEAGLAGQGGGQAIAEVIFGATNPSGKLSVTVPMRLEDTPAYL